MCSLLVSHDAPYCVDQDSEQSACAHLSHATQLGFFFRFLTYPHTASPDCHGLRGKGGQRKKMQRKMGKTKDKTTQGPEPRRREHSARDVCMMIPGTESKSRKISWEQTHRKEKGNPQMTGTGYNTREDLLSCFG